MNFKRNKVKNAIVLQGVQLFKSVKAASGTERGLRGWNLQDPV